MSLASADPLQVLEAVRKAARLRTMTEKDFVAPSGDDERALELAGPGVIHPTHVAWVAECLGRSAESVVATLEEPGPDDDFASLARALAAAKAPSRLRELGVTPPELLLRRLPVAAGNLRQNAVPPAGGPAVLSAENAAWQNLLRSSERLESLGRLEAPDIIVDNQALEVQWAFRRVVHLLRGLGPEFRPEHRPNMEPPLPSELVVLPARRSPGILGTPASPIEVRLTGTTAVLRFPVALALVDLKTGRFSVQPFAGGGFARISDREAVFCDGLRLSVLDLARGDFVVNPQSLPPRVILGACCGVEILDTARRETALLPGPFSSSGHGFATSPCGRFGWLDMVPAADEVGVFSLETMTRAFAVWPHAGLGVPASAEDPGEGHDDTPRAVAAFGDRFRLVYGRHVLFGEHAHELPLAPRAVSFDHTATRLVTVDEEHLTLFELGPTASPKLSGRWSLAPLGPHLTLDAFDLSGLGVDADDVIAAVGTVAALAECSADDLASRLFAEPTAESLERLIDQARRVVLPSQLDRA